MLRLFKDRADAGQQLAAQLQRFAERDDVLVLALPRGGVPVAYKVACALHAPLDVLLVRKLGVPGQRELAMGALASGGVCVLNQDVINLAQISHASLDAITALELKELERRERIFRSRRLPPLIRDRTVILVDDGIATGATMRAAIQVLRAQQAGSIMVAVPIAAQEICVELRATVDELVCLLSPEPFYAIGYWYLDFTQVEDAEVRALLAQAASPSFHVLTS
jgi:putative phosphoribosyl transferase